MTKVSRICSHDGCVVAELRPIDMEINSRAAALGNEVMRLGLPGVLTSFHLPLLAYFDPVATDGSGSRLEELCGKEESAAVHESGGP